MRILATAIIGLAVVAASTQAASACDLEGLGFTRVNPFAHHAAWNVPADQSAQQGQPQNDSAAQAQEASNQEQQTSADTAQQRATSAGFTPVSANSSATQSERLTVTKD